MTTKIKIDIANGLVEVEGSEEFVRSVYDDVKKKLASEPVVQRIPPPTTPGGTERDSGGSRAKSAGGTKKRTVATSTASTGPKKNLHDPASIKSLDLSGSPAGRLRDFYAKYEVETNYERNLIFLYFLQHKMGIEAITQDHVFTCYRDIPGIKVPVALRQSLLDTDQKRNWVDVANPDDLKVTVHGVNHLEHDMPKKQAA